MVVGLHEAPYQTTTAALPRYPSGGACHDSYYQCDEYNPCYEKEVCVQGCCVNATCGGPEYYCFSNGEYQCYENEVCGATTGCCETNPGAQNAAYATTVPPYNPAYQAYTTTVRPYAGQYQQYATTVPPYVQPHQQHAAHQGHRPGHQAPHQPAGHGAGHHGPTAGYPPCDAYYHCTSISDCYEGETCTSGCCSSGLHV